MSGEPEAPGATTGLGGPAGVPEEPPGAQDAPFAAGRWSGSSGGGGGDGRAPRRRRRWPWVALGSLAAAVVLVGAAVAWVDHEANPGKAGPPVVVSLPAGPASSLGGVLSSHGVVGQGWLFDLYARAKGDPSVQPGAYLLHRSDSFSGALTALSNGPPEYKVTIPEGYTVAQIAERVGRLPGHSPAGFLAAARSGRVRSPYEPPGSSNLEGLLFPDTYSVGLKDSDESVLEQMVKRFDQVAASVGLDKAPSEVGISPYQAVTVASIVEREAKLPPDRGKVARVVYNRLQQGMHLDIDATVIYGLGGGITDLTQKDLQTPTPYNTYLISGLPPTPIANPGIPSLQAALSPTAGPWLYYVVTSPDGGESFSATYAGQQANIALAKSRGLG